MAAEFDLVIRGGTVVDGTGRAPIDADIGIKGNRIAAIGTIAGAGAEEIEAKGKLVTPGFVDIHTHYDGQAVWDSQHDAVLLARRHDSRDGQLRRGLRTLQAGRPREAGRIDGRRGGHSRPRHARGLEVGVGIVQRVPDRARAPQPRHRPVRAAAARGGARVRHGRARGATGERESGRHCADARHRRRCNARRRVRFFHLPQPVAQEPEGRSDADIARAGGRADRHRARHARRGVRVPGDRVGMGARSRGRVRDDPPRGGKMRPQRGVHADPAPRAPDCLARFARLR